MIAQSELAYLIDAKDQVIDIGELGTPDVFLSAYNGSHRVQHVFDCIGAAKKFWWILPEYGYETNDLATIVGADGVITGLPTIESDLVIEAIQNSGIEDPSDLDICIDITGFMQPQIFFILRYFSERIPKSLTVVYSEPERYMRGADTDFTSPDIREVRQISGYEGIHVPDTSRDVLLLGVGYDHKLMGQAIRFKEGARLLQLLSLPSLTADMYQESLLRVDKVDTREIRPPGHTEQFCSANDPYLVAAGASHLYHREQGNGGITNFYLCPLATKPQALGFAIFYLQELAGTPSSVIFPFPKSYVRETSEGIGRIWKYPIYCG